MDVHGHVAQFRCQFGALVDIVCAIVSARLTLVPDRCGEAAALDFPTFTSLLDSCEKFLRHTDPIYSANLALALAEPERSDKNPVVVVRACELQGNSIAAASENAIGSFLACDALTIDERTAAVVAFCDTVGAVALRKRTLQQQNIMNRGVTSANKIIVNNIRNAIGVQVRIVLIVAFISFH